jgi:hypothetical protein
MARISGYTNMKILTLARKCGNHAALFACFKISDHKLGV